MIKWYGKLFYGAGNLGYGLVSQTMTSFIMLFGTVACGMPGTLMGVAVAIGTIWDAITDPIIGSISDRWNARLLGRRHGFILVGTFGMALLNVFLWNAPQANNAAMFLWFTVFIVALETFNTFFATPYTALGIELSGDYHEQTVIQGYKSVFFLLGMIIPTLMMALLQAGKDPTNLEPYRNMSYICSTFAIIFGTVCFFGTYSHLPRLKAKAQLSGVGYVLKRQPFKKTFQKFFSIFKKPYFRSIIVGYAISLMAAAFLTSVGFHMFLYSFRLTSTMMYLLMGTLFIMTILFQPLWVFLSDKYSKKKALIIGMTVTAVGALYVGVVFCFRGAILPDTGLLVKVLLPALILVGIGTGSMYSLPISMIADAVAYDSVKGGSAKAGTTSGCMTFAYKISQAGATFVIGILLDIIGFNINTIKQPDGSLNVPPVVDWGLGLIVVLGVLAALVGGMIAYSKYRLKRSDIPSLDLVVSPEYTVESLPRQIEREHVGFDDPMNEERLSQIRSSLGINEKSLYRKTHPEEKTDDHNHGES